MGRAASGGLLARAGRSFATGSPRAPRSTGRWGAPPPPSAERISRAAVAHGHGAKVNDVVLTAVAGGAQRPRAGERSRARPEDHGGGLDSRARRRSGHRQPGGDHAGPAAQDSRSGPPAGRDRPSDGETEATSSLPAQRPAFQRLWVRAMFHQRLVNLFTSNLPGPPIPLYFAGARILRGQRQVGVSRENITPSGSGSSRTRGRLNFDIVGDADVVPDLDVFAEGLRRPGPAGGRTPKSDISRPGGWEQPGEMEERPLGPDRSGWGT